MVNSVTDYPEKDRFELTIEGHVAFATYHKEADVIHITHVEAPPALRGTGAAGKLMRGIMQHIVDNEHKVVPICGYAAAWIKKHKEFHSLLKDT